MLRFSLFLALALALVVVARLAEPPADVCGDVDENVDNGNECDCGAGFDVARGGVDVGVGVVVVVVVENVVDVNGGDGAGVLVEMQIDTLYWQPHLESHC